MTIRSSAVGLSLTTLLALPFAGGCADHGASAARPDAMPLSAIAPATGPANPHLPVSLDEIRPVVSLPSPATRPTTAAPLDAYQLYAQARRALLDHERERGVALLQRAAQLDPYSYELHSTLAHALSNDAIPSDGTIAELEKAAALEPDHLDVHYELARQYQLRNENEKALERLRIARLTTEYRNDRLPDLILLVDFWLARALQQDGYDRAALDMYDSVLQRLAHPQISARSRSDMLYLVQHPAIVFVQVGELYERNGQLSDALRVYQAAADRDEDNFDLGARVVRAKLAVGRVDDAKTATAALVVLNHANADSLALLAEVYHRAASPEDYLAALKKLHTDHPADRQLLGALLDALKAAHRPADAQQLLAQTDAGRFDPEICRKRLALYEEAGESESAMRLLTEMLAVRPDSLSEIGPLWFELIKPSRGSRLRLATLQQLKVAPGAEAAKLFWISRLADLWNRDALSRSAIEKSAGIAPPFSPAYRLLVGQYWNRPDWDNAQKIAECQNLADRVRAQGNAALAAEVEGLSLFQQHQPGKAADRLDTAIQLGGHSPDLLLAQARAFYQDSNPDRAQQILLVILNEWPQFEEAYSELFGLCLQQHSAERAMDVLHRWLNSAPQSVDARLLQATVFTQVGRLDMTTAAQQIIDTLLTEQPANPKVLMQAEEFYTRISRQDEFIHKLETIREQNPQNHEAMELLVTLYARQKRLGDATRVLDSCRVAVSRDPDLLYFVAHLYERIEQKQTTEEILEQVISLEPRHAAASNDLGYAWADAGKNLAQAESLIHTAVEEEPDNQSYLDSMGWVEYKRGKFSEARDYLDKAIGPASRPDPVVLDHMGDVLYRLAKPAEAVRQWERSLNGIDQTSDREDLRQLRLQLKQKLDQQQSGRPVNVAPIVEEKRVVAR